MSWIVIQDTTISEENPLVISDETIQLTNNGGSIINLTGLEEDVYYDFNKNVIDLGTIEDTYSIRIDFLAKQLTNNSKLSIRLDIGNESEIEIISDTKEALNTFKPIFFDLPVYALNTFKANGAKIKLTAEGSFEIIRYALFIVKTTDHRDINNGKVANVFYTGNFSELILDTIDSNGLDLEKSNQTIVFGTSGIYSVSNYCGLYKFRRTRRPSEIKIDYFLNNKQIGEFVDELTHRQKSLIAFSRVIRIEAGDTLRIQTTTNNENAVQVIANPFFEIIKLQRI